MFIVLTCHFTFLHLTQRRGFNELYREGARECFKFVTDSTRHLIAMTTAEHERAKQNLRKIKI